MDIPSRGNYIKYNYVLHFKQIISKINKKIQYNSSLAFR